MLFVVQRVHRTRFELKPPSPFHRVDEHPLQIDPLAPIRRRQSRSASFSVSRALPWAPHDEMGLRTRETTGHRRRRR
jgi:hypothetical protein